MAAFDLRDLVLLGVSVPINLYTVNTSSKTCTKEIRRQQEKKKTKKNPAFVFGNRAEPQAARWTFFPQLVKLLRWGVEIKMVINGVNDAPQASCWLKSVRWELNFLCAQRGGEHAAKSTCFSASPPSYNSCMSTHKCTPARMFAVAVVCDTSLKTPLTRAQVQPASTLQLYCKTCPVKRGIRLINKRMDRGLFPVMSPSCSAKKAPKKIC